MRLAAVTLWTLLYCSLVLFVLSADEDSAKNHGKKKGPKSPKQKATKQPPSAQTKPPEARTVEDWEAMPLDDVRRACELAGLEPDGAIPALAIRLVDYYDEVRQHNDIAESQHDTHYNRFHPYSQQHDTHVQDAIREHEELMRQCNAALDKVVQAQQLPPRTALNNGAPTLGGHPRFPPGMASMSTNPSSSTSWTASSAFKSTGGPRVPPPRQPTTWSSNQPFSFPAATTDSSWHGPGPLPQPSGNFGGDMNAFFSALRDTITDSIAAGFAARDSSSGGVRELGGRMAGTSIRAWQLRP